MSVGSEVLLVEDVSLAKTQEKPESVFQNVVKVAQRYSKAFEPRAQTSPPPGTTTEVERLREQLDAADRSLRDSLVECAEQVAAAATSRRQELAARLVALERQRADSERRRNELADAAAGVNYDWHIEHKQDRDAI